MAKRITHSKCSMNVSCLYHYVIVVIIVFIQDPVIGTKIRMLKVGVSHPKLHSSQDTWQRISATKVWVPLDPLCDKSFFANISVTDKTPSRIVLIIISECICKAKG